MRLARFIEEFETHVNDLEDAGQEDDLPAGRRALSLMSRALTENGSGCSGTTRTTTRGHKRKIGCE